MGADDSVVSSAAEYYCMLANETFSCQWYIQAAAEMSDDITQNGHTSLSWPQSIYMLCIQHGVETTNIASPSLIAHVYTCTTL